MDNDLQIIDNVLNTIVAHAIMKLAKPSTIKAQLGVAIRQAVDSPGVPRSPNDGASLATQSFLSRFPRRSTSQELKTGEVNPTSGNQAPEVAITGGQFASR